MDKNTTFKYWLAVARHTSYKIGKQPRPAFVGEKQVPGNLNQLSIGQLIDLSQLSDSEESLYQIVTTVLGLSHKEVEQARAVDVVMLIGWVTSEVERISEANKTGEGGRHRYPAVRTVRHAGLVCGKDGHQRPRPSVEDTMASHLQVHGDGQQEKRVRAEPAEVASGGDET